MSAFGAEKAISEQLTLVFRLALAILTREGETEMQGRGFLGGDITGLQLRDVFHPNFKDVALKDVV